MSSSGKRKWCGIAVLIFTATLFLAQSAMTQRVPCPEAYPGAQWVSLGQALQMPSKDCDCPDRTEIMDEIIFKTQEMANLPPVTDDSTGDYNDDIAKKFQQGQPNPKPIPIDGKTANEKTGFNSFQCVPYVCDQKVKNECKQRWMCDFLHEQAHCAFDASLNFAQAVASGMNRKYAKELQRESEIIALQIQISCLEQVLDALNRKCAKRVLSGPDDQAGDKIRLASSADRVGGYSSTM